MSASSEIIYVTYLPDLEWLQFSLKSVSKFARGFSAVKIVVPWDQLGSFIPFESIKTADGAPVVVKKFIETPGKGFLGHASMICSADIFCPKADFIFHMDPDCLFNGPLTPDDYFSGGKPVLQMVRYDKFPQGRAEYLWQKNAMEALGYKKEQVPFETMQRHCAVHYRSIYSSVRSRVEQVHNTPFHQFVLEQRNEYPQTFAEFPTLGAYAYENMRDKYSWEELDAPDIKSHPKTAHKVTQFWSHASRDPKHWELYQNQLRMARRIVA